MILHTMRNLRTLMIIGLLSIGLLVGMSASAQQENAIDLQITAQPASFDIKGTGLNDRSTVTVRLSGPAPSGDPVDLVLALDASTSVDFELVRTAAREIISQLSANDRVAIVSFSDIARLELTLSSDKSQALSILDSISRGSQTAMGDGLMMAVDELAQNLRTNTKPMIVMPTDGVHNVGTDPLSEAQRSGVQGYPVYPIGTSPAARGLILSEIASESNGRYFSSYSDIALERIMGFMGREVVANYLHITTTLPAPLKFERSIKQHAAVNLGREVTQVEWYVRHLFEGSTWEAQYEISANRDATTGLLRNPSTLEYRTASGALVVLDLLQLGLTIPTLTVGEGSGIPDGGTNGTTDPENGTDNGTNGSTNSQNGENQGNSAQPPTLTVTGVDAETTYLTGEALSFDLSGTTDPDGTITLLEIDWTNDGIVDVSLADPDLSVVQRRAFARAGEYTIRILITDNGGNVVEQLITVMIEAGLKAIAAHSTDFSANPTPPDWMDYYIKDGVVTDEEVRDASARFSADVFIPGTEYRLTEADLQAIINLNELLTLVTAYETAADAEAAGYVRVGDPVPGVGQHYVNESYLRGEPMASHPPVLLFDVDGGSMVLAGVRYISTSAESTLFQISSWPSHPASAHYADGTETAASDINNIQPENSAGAAFVFWHPQIYGLTVWVSTINTNGLFASTNPDVAQ